MRNVRLRKYSRPCKETPSQDDARLTQLDTILVFSSFREYFVVRKSHDGCHQREKKQPYVVCFE